MKSNTLTIIKKEFARFFGDRQLLFTTVIMPGLMIYLVYSLMGNGINKMITEGANEVVTLQVENMPASLAPMFYNLDSNLVVTLQPFGDEDIKKLEDKEINGVLLRFPEAFDERIAVYDPTLDMMPANVEIYYNSTNNASSRVYMIISTMLNNYGRSFTVNVLSFLTLQTSTFFDISKSSKCSASLWLFTISFGYSACTLNKSSSGMSDMFLRFVGIILNLAANLRKIIGLCN